MVKTQGHRSTVEQWLAAVGGGWRLAAVGGGWRLAAVGGWWFPGAVLKCCPQQKKEFFRTALGEAQKQGAQLCKTSKPPPPTPVSEAHGGLSPTSIGISRTHNLYPSPVHPLFFASSEGWVWGCCCLPHVGRE